MQQPIALIEIPSTPLVADLMIDNVLSLAQTSRGGGPSGNLDRQVATLLRVVAASLPSAQQDPLASRCLPSVRMASERGTGPPTVRAQNGATHRSELQCSRRTGPPIVASYNAQEAARSATNRPSRRTGPPIVASYNAQEAGRSATN